MIQLTSPTTRNIRPPTVNPQPPIVAEWAGHSVQVLLRVYAKCIGGQDALRRRLIEDTLGTPEPPKEDSEDNDQDDEQSES